MKMLDLFSGIGGFHKGFEQAGFKFDWVGFSEIDKYASAVYKYNYKESEELGDITTIRPGRDTPDNIDILCAGFPCQAFSMAGKRKGFNDTRGTLFFEIARILRHYKDVKNPIPCLVLENVKGLLSHDNGRTFTTIYRVLDNIGYTIEFQLLNTRWWLPQNRERIYIVGYIGNRSKSQIFPIREDGARNNEKRFSGKTPTGHKQGMFNSKDRRGCSMLRGSEKIEIFGNTKSGGERSKIHSSKGIMSTLTATDYKQAKQVMIIDKKGDKKNNQDYAATLCGGGHSGGNHSDMDLVKIADYRTDEGMRIRKNNTSPCLTSSNNNQTELSRMAPLLIKKTKDIRRLTPIECMRLQGFSDNHNKYGIMDGKVVEISDTQRYKQAGNAVTVDVVQAIADKIKKSNIFKR